MATVIADHIFGLTGGKSPDRRDETTYLNTSTNYPGPSKKPMLRRCLRR